MNFEIKTLVRNLLVTIGALLVPLALALTFLRLLLTPVFVQVEYRLPYFPEDSYGFTMKDRLHYSQIALKYLVNDEDISFLKDLSFEDGSQLYNDGELEHMVDVKEVVQLGLQTWYGLLGVFMMIGGWSYRFDKYSFFKEVVGLGGQITVGLLLALLTYLVVNFNQLFVRFHGLFFEDGTWTFYYSDTLIRLFPEIFWRDAFAALGGLTLLAGGLLWYFMSWRPKRKTK